MLCEHLEDYICRLLTSDEAEQFEAHLDECAKCREAVAEETDLFDLVVEGTRLEPVPSTIVLPKPRIAQPQRRSNQVVAAISSLAVVLVMAFLLSTDDSEPAPAEKSVAIADNRVRPPVIQLPDSTPGISIPTDDPNIQIVLINAPQSKLNDAL